MAPELDSVKIPIAVSGLMRKAGYHHGDLRRALIEASLAIVGDGGAAALSFRAVARSLGVSHAAPLHHFSDKRELLEAVASVGFERLAALLERSAARAGADPVARLQATGVAYVRFALDQPELFRLMFGPELAAARSREHSAAGQRAFEAMRREAAASLAALGELDPERLRVVTTAAWSLVHGLATLSIDRRLAARGARDTLRLAQAVTALVASALRP
jgi:AcrR family transcriptional regulator